MIRKKQKNNPKIHFIISGETGKNRGFSLYKNTLRNTSVALVVLFSILGFGTFKTIDYLLENRELYAQGRELKNRADQLEAELKLKTTQFASELRSNNEANAMVLLATKNKLNRQIVATKDELSRELNASREKISLIAHQKEELTIGYQKQLDTLIQEHESVVEGSISRLDERSEAIKGVIDQLGVKVKIKNDPKHSGGLYISIDSYCDKLIDNTDSYLTTLLKMPLGHPVNTSISSSFGKRTDPFNKKQAFHAGIDFRGKTGDRVRSTGDAIVKSSTYSKGLGHYVILSHGNGYETVYAHLSKRLVKKGDKVKRGKSIGLVGNSGRSTGSHLHYEMRRYGKVVNPMKYLKVADLTVTTLK
ncbi:MAG: peptidoglycan DD-metalloendopeptidase family protein [Desulfobulbaceae bacterium]|nr:peptidoglycan DD-metalloendopeptidase family protein [Desulfobulbaceae bacterium]